MVTKAKKALLVSLAAFLCVMLTVFGLSMSVSLSETAKAADETTTEVAEVSGVKFATLAEAIAAAKDGDTVTLLADATEDVVVDKNITLDLGGKTLTGTNSGYATLSIQNGATTTIKNGSIVGSTSYYTIEIIKGSNATATFENLTATAGNTGSSMIDNWGTLTINSGTYKGGLNVVKSEEGSTLVINGGKFTLAHSVSNSYNGVVFAYGDTTIRGGEFIQSLTACGRWNHPQVVVTGVVEGYTAITRVTGGSFTNARSGEGIFRGVGKATSANFKVSGGTFNKSVSDSYFADGFKVVKISDDIYGVKVEPLTFGEDGICRISTEAELKRFAAMANAGDNFAGKTVYLENDINLNNELWTPIGVYKDSTTHFKGTFDGRNHTITGLNVTEYSKNGVGFFGKVYNGTIKNLTVEGTVSAPGCNYVGGIVGHGYATITNCTFKGNVGTKTTIQVGGIAGSGGFTITNCSVYGNVIAKCWAGGIVGNCQDGGDYTNCYVVGTISSEITYWGGGAAGITPVPLHPWQVISKCYSDTVVKVAGKEVNCPIIAAYNNPLDCKDSKGNPYTGDLKIYDNSWNKAKNSNDSYPIYAEKNGVGGVLEEGKDVSRDNALIMLEGDLDYIDNLPRSEIKILPGSAVTEETIDNMTVAAIGEKKYFSLQAAIGAAPRNAIVTLLANTKENVTIAKALTLDLNGYTINGGTEKGKPAVTVTARIVTIQDSSAAQTGTIKREDTVDNSGVSSHYVIDVQGNGWLIFKSGNVINHSGNDEGKGASLVRVGDDSVAKYPGLNIKGGTFTQDNFIVIKVDRGDLFLNGGTLNSANSYAIETWHRATVKNGTVNGAVSSWVYSGGLNSTLEISGGTINGDVESVTYDGAAGKLAKVSITGGTVTGTLSHSVYGQSGEADKAMATIEVSGGTFSADPTKYVVEDSAITKNADGTFGVEKAYLAKVGDTSYYTMDEAFKAQTASGEAIVLLRDYTTGSEFKSGTKHRVVDLNGHTWTYTGSDADCAAFEINYSNATLTVKNGKIISNLLVGLIPSAMSGTITYDNAGLVFEGVTMTSNGGSGIETNGNNTNDSVTLKNSTLNVPNGFGIYFPSSGTLTIDNSTINAKTMGVQVCSGMLNINAGSVITVEGDAVPKAENDGAIQDGAAISIVNRPGYKGLSNIVITGGTFTAKAGNDAIKAYDWVNKVESTFTKADLVAVSGGTFSSEVNKDYLADGFVVNKNTDGTYGVKAAYVAEVNGDKYETLQAAFEAARVGTSKVVTLLADYTATEKGGSNPGVVYDITGVTFDLGGHKFSASNFAVVFAGSNGVIQNGEMICLNGSYALFIGDAIETKGFTASNLTLTGGINVYNATMVVLDNLTVNGTNYYTVWADEHASITIESGTYTAGDVAALNAAAKSAINVTGGTFITNDKPLMGDSKGTLQISGGTFSSEVNKDYLAKGYRLTKTGESYGVTEKYIASSTVSLGVDLSFKYEMVKGKSVDRVVASYYKVNETEATEYELTNVTIDGVVYYVFNGITPQMIDRKISVNVYVGNTVIYDVVEYSILDNLGAVLKKELGSKQDVTRQLVASLAYYGKAAMEYVKYDSSAVQKFIDDNKLSPLTAEIKDGVVAEYDPNETKIARISVQFADTNKVLVGVDEKVFDNYNYTIMVNGQEITSIDWQTGVVSGYNVYVSEGFAARYITDASKYVEVEVLDKNNNNNRVQYVKYNVAGYCMMMEANATMGALATATYNYGVAAANYAA